MNVRKAVIPAAGWGTRFLPVTKSVPKELLPLIDKPVIHFAIEEAVASGISDVILVTSAGKGAIRDYFDRSFELERILEQKGDTKRLQLVRSPADLANIITVRQSEQLGLGHAVLMAKAAVGNEPFAVFLPDDILEAPRPVIRQLMDVHDRSGGSVIAVQRVNDADVTRYGIVDGQPEGNRTYKLRRVVEKPKLLDAPSRLAIIGRYILAPEIFGLLESGKLGAIGEVQLTDAIDGLIRTQSVYAHEYDGTLYDAGTPLGLLKASIMTALMREDMAADFRSWLREVAARELR